MAAHWSDQPVTRTDAEVDREALLFACTRVARHDVHVRRALLRRAFLLDRPDDLWADEDVIAQARDELTRHPFDASRHTPGPSRDEMLSTIAHSESGATLNQRRTPHAGPFSPPGQQTRSGMHNSRYPR